MKDKEFDEVLKVTRDSTKILNEAVKSYISALVCLIRKAESGYDDRFLTTLNELLINTSKVIIDDTNKLFRIANDSNLRRGNIENVITKEIEKYSVIVDSSDKPCTTNPLPDLIKEFLNKRQSDGDNQEE